MDAIIENNYTEMYTHCVIFNYTSALNIQEDVGHQKTTIVQAFICRNNLNLKLNNLDTKRK